MKLQKGLYDIKENRVHPLEENLAKIYKIGTYMWEKIGN